MPKLCRSRVSVDGALLLADHAHRLAAEAAEAADDRLVLAELAVARKRREIGDERADIIEAMRPLRMARHLRLLPRRQLAIELLERLVRLALEARDLLADETAFGPSCRARSSSTFASSSATGFSKSR